MEDKRLFILEWFGDFWATTDDDDDDDSDND